MSAETERLGLDAVNNRAAAEYDLVKSLLEAADFRTSDNSVISIDIRRNGKFYFSIRLHPLGDDEVRQARKYATVYGKNPQGAKYPQIEKDFNASLFNSWMIYLATVPEDQEKIWGNPTIKEKYNLLQNVETIDILLRFGEKSALLDQISKISGMEEETSLEPEEYAKN